MRENERQRQLVEKNDGDNCDEAPKDERKKVGARKAKNRHRRLLEPRSIVKIAHRLFVAAF